MKNLPLISVITVNYNQSDATCEMLESLYASGYPNLEVFVVDNASSAADNAEKIKEKFPGVIFIQNKINLGFAGGNNIALKEANGNYIYLLNNDTVIPEGNPECLVTVLADDPAIGVVCPKIKFYSDPDIIQFAGYTEMSEYTFRNRSIGYAEPDNGQYDLRRETAFAHGAAMMLKREVIEKTGLMNEHYFLYYEELDWSRRIRSKGYRIVYIPDTYILHKEALSTGKNSSLQVYYMNRNRVLYVKCNTSGMQKIISIIYQLLVVMPKNMLKFLFRRHFKNMKAVFRAWWASIRMPRSMCKYEYL
ncbi:MAG: glycosyltransferase family 2 protein [Bacteroidales bacterium]|jgi:GT2 family glycosyltransferase|nr:glycosyltransferase family 2 protein [Bacteroidales bacterium]